MDEELTGSDYLNMSLKDLVNHPNFDSKAQRVMNRLCQLTTSELIQIDVSKLPQSR